MAKNKLNWSLIFAYASLVWYTAFTVSDNLQYETNPNDAARMFGFGGLCLCFMSYIGYGVSTRKRDENCFISGLICLGISALFWIEIMFDYLWGVK